MMIDEYQPGEQAIVIDDGGVMFNIGGEAGTLQPGDEVTILRRAPDHDDDVWGRAYWFRREGWPDEFVLGTSMIRRT
jgi:hypothetical protein